MQNLVTKRFVIRKSLIGKNQVKSRFESMPCFEKYGSYTNSKNLPKFVRELKEIV